MEKENYCSNQYYYGVEILSADSRIKKCIVGKNKFVYNGQWLTK